MAPPARRRKLAKWLAGALAGGTLSLLDQSQEIFAGRATFCGFVSAGLACTITLGAGIAALLELSFDYRHDSGMATGAFLSVLWSQVATLSVCFFIFGAMKYRAADHQFDPDRWTSLNTISLVLSVVALFTGGVTVWASERKVT